MSDIMNLSSVDFIIDHNDIYLSHEHSSFMSLFHIRIDKSIYPNRRYKGLPLLTLSYFIKELRLLISKENTINERHIYFYPETTNFIKFKLIDNETVLLEFVQRKNSAKNIIQSIFSKDGRLESSIVYCQFNELFVVLYKTAETLINRLNNRKEHGGDFYALEYQVRLAKSLFNKLVVTINDKG
ncbi:hypothetical protein RB620_00990 [Paenibacillus sp. LHD-117]|uniref:hypothetical protein n=1 Tax=Paenibacillus sp. LHD-117 TaxID=3071412 RepID=UPI0027DEC911|nr:hypothetical protein [Paenibacillus sp. LHD-117]MDQ6418000.1 hypothetical protein [Paenibacillus sp. LHD-117]